MNNVKGLKKIIGLPLDPAAVISDSSTLGKSLRKL
jgi:hypothetical protein